MLRSTVIVRRSEYRAVPWKNGGGITHELVRAPAAGEYFSWRVSVARIDVSGPFSDFAGYRRSMVLLHGDGLRLSFAGGAQHVLRTAGEWLDFDGAPAAHCELLGGPCYDLNFMVAHAAQAHAWVQPLDTALRLSAAGLNTALIFPIDAPLLLSPVGCETLRLEPWDLAILSDVEAGASRAEPANSAAPSRVFFANIGDQSQDFYGRRTQLDSR